MGKFNRDDRKFGGGKSFGGKFGGKPTMHQATCSDCGNNCEVPFRPTGERPVYCSDCFGKQDGGRGTRPSNFGNDRRERPSFSDREMHDAVCNKCGNNCQVPFKPTFGKPIFCSDCFKKDGGGESRGGRDSGSAEVMEQIKQINYKLDKLMKALLPEDVVKAEKANDTKGLFGQVKAKKEKSSKVKTVKAEKVKKVKTKTKVAPKKTVTKKKKK